MKRLLVLILVVTIGALVVGAFARGNHAAPAQGTAPATIVVATSTVSETTDAYTIDAQYPQFGIPAIDAQLRQAEDDAIASLKAEPQVPHGMTVAVNSFTGRFDKVSIGTNYISVELILSEYTGGAHPNTAFTGFVFDRTTGKRLTLDEALALTDKALGDIASSSAAQLSASLGDSFFPDGAQPTRDNYGDFLVSDDAVTFVFGQYQVAPYVYGPQYVSVPRVR